VPAQQDERTLARDAIARHQDAFRLLDYGAALEGLEKPVPIDPARMCDCKDGSERGWAGVCQKAERPVRSSGFNERLVEHVQDDDRCTRELLYREPHERKTRLVTVVPPDQNDVGFVCSKVGDRPVDATHLVPELSGISCECSGPWWVDAGD
jgi:hypothetical protein